MSYAYLGTLRTQPGRRDEVARALADGSDALRTAGCQLYVVSVSAEDPDRVWVSEVWDSKEHHDASLLRTDVRAAIAKTLPKLTGEITNRELHVVGGLGVID